MSSPTARRWCTSPGIRGAMSCGACTAGCGRRSSCRCTARPAISRRRPSSPATMGVRDRASRVHDGEIVRLAPDPAVIDDAPGRRVCSATAACWCPRPTGRCVRAASFRSSASSSSLRLSRRGEPSWRSRWPIIDGVPAEDRRRRGRCSTCARRGRRHAAQHPGPERASSPKLVARGRSPRRAGRGRTRLGARSPFARCS